VPVRIIFRGLTLFQFPETGPNAGKLVVYLINKPELTGGFENASRPQRGHGRHEHDHSGEIQILSGEGQGHDSKPVLLERGVNVDIVVPGTGDQPVSWSPSFERYVPNLDTVIANGTDAVRNAGRGDPNLGLIQNVVTVDRGVAHVKHVIDWDQERYPLSGNPDERGQRPGSPVLVTFMGSSIGGHMASEVIVEIDNADEVDLRSKQEKKLNGRRKGTDQPNHRVPIGTVEVLVTNYEFRRDGPVAWGLDYQWLFETVGYRAAELAGQEFEDWSTFARRFDPESYESERALLLEGPNRTVGRPFPYIASEGSLTPLQPLTDQHNPPVCASGYITITYTETETLPDGTVKTKTLRIELGPQPPAPPPTTT
jgi:hypothetical protein